MRARACRHLLAVGAACLVAIALLAAPPDAAAGNHKDKAKDAPGHAKGHAKGRAKGKGHGEGPGYGAEPGDQLLERSIDRVAEAWLTERERRIIRESFRGGYPAGFQRPKPLPPGIRKKLARGGRLPPGIAKTRLPDSVVHRLPRRDGEEILVIDDDVYLVRQSGQLILDVLENVLQ